LGGVSFLLLTSPNHFLRKGKEMNDEKQIAQAIVDAQKMKEESYNQEEGEYKRDIES